MRYVALSLVLALTALVAIGGCDGDDGDSGVIAQGTNTVPAGGEAVLANVTASVPGTLQAEITWTGEPTELVGAFLHVTPSDVLGITQSPSPLVCTVAVTSARVAAGEEWQLKAYSSAASDVSVQYRVVFTPN
jgi:hypothetical protein